MMKQTFYIDIPDDVDETWCGNYPYFISHGPSGVTPKNHTTRYAFVLDITFKPAPERIEASDLVPVGEGGD